MLNKHAIDSSLALTERFVVNNYNVTSVMGSPLQKLVTATTVNADMYIGGPNAFDINTNLLSEATNTADTVTGYCEHDVVLRESVDFIAEKLASQVAYARNDAAGIVEDLAQNVTAAIDCLQPFAEIGASVIERSIAPILINESFLEAVQESHNCPRYDVRLGLRLPQQSAQEIRSLMKTGLPALDSIISEYMAVLEDSGLELLWSQLFMELNPISGAGKAGTNLTHFIAGEHNVRNAVFVFLIARRLNERIMPGANMSESEYMSLTSDFRNQAAARICDVMDVYANEENNGRLVQKVEGLTVTVNRIVYRKFLEQGGSAEAILGSLLFNESSVNLDAMLENKERYETRWRRQYMMNEQTYRNRRFQRIKELLIIEYTSQTKNSNERDFPVHERAISHELFVNAVHELTIDEMDDMVMTCLKLLGKSRFRNRNVLDILSGVAYARKKNPNVDVKEAASIAIIEYISRWVASQMVITKAGRVV